MLRANDGKPVTAADYRGKIVLLYFGYTNCPDVCPLTLANLSQSLRRLGKDAKQVRVLFVTVDPDRDTAPILKAYVNAFSPEMDGLRGTDNAIAILARRYRVAYSVTPAHDGKPYEVTIWFIVDGDKILLPTANIGRQWVRNVRKTPHVTMNIGGEMFSGEARFLDAAERDRVFGQVRLKYWMFLPMIALGQILTSVGIVKDNTGAFEVTLAQT